MTDPQEPQAAPIPPSPADNPHPQEPQAAPIPPSPADNRQEPQAAPIPPSPADNTHPLDGLISSIRAATAPDASAEARAAGATACRSILTALEAKAGQPLTAAPPVATSATSPLATMLAQLVAMPREQMLEFITNFLRTKLPPGTQTQVTAGPRFHLIQLPQMRQPGGGT